MRRMKIFVQILSLLIFICCCVYMGIYFYKDYHLKSDLSSVQEYVDTTDDEKYAENGMLSEYYELYKKNEDMVGWIKIDGTNIDYPVMYKNTDNDYYLHRNFDREYNEGGIPFMDKECSLAKPSDNLIIYAHNMKNGTMFADLLKYSDEKFLNEHKTVKFNTLYEKEEYTVISVFKTQVGAKNEFKYYNFVDAASEDDFENYVSAAKMLSVHSIDETAVYGDKLLTLSTCSYNKKNERFVVVAKRIK